MRDHYDTYAQHLRQAESWHPAKELMDSFASVQGIRSAIEAQEQMSVFARAAEAADRFGAGQFSDFRGATHVAEEMARRAGAQSISELADRFPPAVRASLTSSALDLYRNQDLSRALLANVISPLSGLDLFGKPEMDELAARIGMVSSSAGALQAHAGLQQQLAGSVAFDRAYELAQAAQQFPLDDYLDSFRTSVGPLTDKMLYLQSLDSIRSEAQLRSFVQASTVADILNNSWGYGSEAQQALEILTRQAISHVGSVKEYGDMLKAAGIALPRWPHVRLLTIGERRKRLHQRSADQESKPAKKAWTVFERHERTLRDSIDRAMSEHYGEDWPHERLAKCKCQKVLNRWKDRGGDALDHADFAHYIDIMCDEEHFEAVFSIGFDDLEGLRKLLNKARELRVPVMHFQPFTKEDLRDVRTTWKAIETGLLGLRSDYELVYH